MNSVAAPLPCTAFRHPIDNISGVICVPAEFTSKSNQMQLHQLIKGWYLTLQDCRSLCEWLNALGWTQMNIFVFSFLCAYANETLKVPFSSHCELICIQPISTSFPYLLIIAHAFMMLTKAYNYSQTVHLSDCCFFRSVQSYEAINEAEERMNKIPINQINHSRHFWLPVSAAAH